MTRKQVLESFLNDKVESVPPFTTLFLWHRIFYEVFPYKEILKDDSRKADHFVKWFAGDILYGIREVSEKVLMTYYQKKFNELVMN
jgi:hypothetical protein